jgi:hypothetical protein
MGKMIMAVKKNIPQVFSNAYPFVNFSGRAYKPRIRPANTAQKIPSIMVVGFR